MSRIAFALLLFGMTAWLASQVKTPTLIGQEKKDKTGKKAKNKEPINPAELKEDTSRVLPVFDPGSHTRPISAMGFSKDKSKLITVGQDFTIQVWNVATGERLDILRLPGYGREKGYDPGRWDVAAVSPDGTRVAVGGQQKFLFDTEAKENAPARLILVDVPNRKVMRVQMSGNNSPVEALAFSADGESLAVALAPGLKKERANLFVVSGLTERMAKANPLLRTTDCPYTSTPHVKKIITMAFSPDGKQLVLGPVGEKASLWSVLAGAAPQPKLVKEIATENHTASIVWSPDGKQFARSWRSRGTGEGRERGIELRNPEGDLIKSWDMPALEPALERKHSASIHTVCFLDANTLFFVANGTFGDRVGGGGTIAGIVDTTTGKARRVTALADGMVSEPKGAVTSDGSLVALTVTGNCEVLIGKSKDETNFVRCGQRTPIPYFLGWSKDPNVPGFAWTERRVGTSAKSKERSPEDLRFGFDLTKVEPVGEIRGADYDVARWKMGDWRLDDFGKGKKDPDAVGRMLLLRGDTVVVGFGIARSAAHTMIPNGDKAPLVAGGDHEEYGSDRAYLYGGDGKLITRLLPDATTFTDMASSPDGRFLIAATGSPRLVVYRTDGSPYPLLSFAQLNGEWVCWTPEGYYAASPGGEKMFGWAISNGPNKLATFHPAQQYSKQFRRPDVIKLAIELGSVEAALKKLATEPESIENIAPPKAEIKLLKQAGAIATVTASASSGVKDKPVRSMQLLLDGRPLAEGRGVLKVESGKPAETEWDVPVPAGSHELRMIVRTDEEAAISDPLVVTGPKNASEQPTIYRLCVGINDYDDSGLKLSASTKDAADVFAALEKNCVGSQNRFGTAKGELIFDKAATRDAVLKAIGAIRKAAKPGDLVVFYFAGHGVKQGEEYYLLTREADTTKNLKDISLSGADLRKALGDIECPVLLIMDACHSAKGAKAFRPATDDLTRSLTEDSTGVTVMAAAMAHEVAMANSENGYFTAALLKALEVGEGVPFDPYERALYTHHIYSVIFSEVRKATHGKQNPFLNSPWTVPPLAVREIAKP